MKKVFVSLLGLSALAVASFANQVSLTYVGPDPNLSVKLVYNSSTVYHDDIGKLNFHNNTDNTNFTTICSDLLDGISIGDTHNYNVGLAPPGGNAGQQKAAAIVATYFNSAVSADDQAALQLAVWDAVYLDGATFNLSNNSSILYIDTTFGNQGFGQGNAPYHPSNADVNTIMTDAATYYSASSGTANWYTHLPGQGGQDQMSPVPEPSSFGVLALGLAGLVRRKFRKA